MNPHPSPIIIDILDYARLAPSVHNTQPWSFTTEGMSITLLVNKARLLVDGDPTGRELWISLGVCLETLITAAQALGHKAVITEQQTDTIEQPIAVVTITPGVQPRQQQLIDLVKQRHSYRGPMQPISLPGLLLATCRDAAKDLSGISIHLTDARSDIEAIADLTYKGMRLALSSPAFRHELADLINYNWSKARVGMHGFVLNRRALGSVWEKWSIKLGLDIRKKALADRIKISNASGLLFIATEGDVPRHWLAAGRAYYRTCLVITKVGLAHSTIAAPVEAASFHEDVERLLHTPHRIQTMIRVGKAAHQQRKFSPRLTVEELLT